MMTDLKATYRIGTEDTNDFVNDKTFIMCKLVLGSFKISDPAELQGTQLVTLFVGTLILMQNNIGAITIFRKERILVNTIYIFGSLIIFFPDST